MTIHAHGGDARAQGNTNELATSGRALIFLNPLPNRRKAKLLAALEHALVQEGSTWHRFETFAQLERTVAAVETLLQQETFDRVVVLGGDGTLHQAVNALVASRLPVGYLPCGTGNDFARGWFSAFTSTATLTDWVEQALHGTPHAIDLGQVGSRYFANVAGVGFDGDLVRRMGVKKFLWPRFSYLWSACLSLLRYREQPLALRGTQQKLLAVSQRPTFMLIAANNQFFGAGMHIAPHALVDDGYLAYCLVEKMPLWRKLLALQKLYRGAHVNLHKVHTGQFSALEITTPNLPVEADGELIGMTPVRIRTIPAAFLLRAVD
ncbi:diacylglycerol/lipid kinase family protein [Aliidiomarina haloalkalitolerans]|uniref:DAGKc domain-containing protein n=1 Tax=Aliidiomarina haloalkalitolerans TaxID=859059 RepID=A0A432VYM4_9GAMM|nr:diacylglycerol kinase family protein [Aliidiomarina haloalkalitolerans]MCL4409332.1 diacylglycerol kinase family lipid kinase [Gammaproteobacteria bacterium]RUO21771.1 hypothetical protein CWE06_02675 [Aliidiomarina haloalkalitolerans]